MFSVYARMTAKPGQRDAVVELLKRFEQAIEQPPALSISVAIADEVTLWVTETWPDKATHDAGTHSEPARALTRQVLDLLAEPPTGEYGHLVHRS